MKALMVSNQAMLLVDRMNERMCHLEESKPTHRQRETNLLSAELTGFDIITKHRGEVPSKGRQLRHRQDTQEWETERCQATHKPNTKHSSYAH